MYRFISPFTDYKHSFYKTRYKHASYISKKNMDTNLRLIGKGTYMTSERKMSIKFGRKKNADENSRNMQIGQPIFNQVEPRRQLIVLFKKRKDFFLKRENWRRRPGNLGQRQEKSLEEGNDIVPLEENWIVTRCHIIKFFKLTYSQLSTNVIYSNKICHICTDNAKYNFWWKKVIRNGMKSNIKIVQKLWGSKVRIL